VVKSRSMRRTWHAARMGETRSKYKMLVEHRDGRRQLGRPRRRCEDDINMDIKEIFVKQIHLLQDRVQCRALVNTVIAVDCYKICYSVKILIRG
jgi:hypothetical protein